MRDEAGPRVTATAVPPPYRVRQGKRGIGHVRSESPREDTAPDIEASLIGGSGRRRLRRETLEAATALFAERHMAQVDVDDLVRHAGLVPQAAASLFTSKQILFALVLERERLKLIAALVVPMTRGDVTRGARTLTDACTMIMGHVFDYHRERPHSLRLVFGQANRALTFAIRREVQCLVRLAVEQCVAQHMPEDERTSCRALSAAVTTSALALSDLVVSDRHEVSCAVLSALAVYGASSAA